VNVTVWMPYCGRVHETTDVPTDVEIVAPDEVRDFVKAHGGRVFVWVRTPRGPFITPCYLEASLEAPRSPDLSFRRLRTPGFDLYLEATQRVWPRTLELALRRRRRVEAYWNGMAWIA
jgi:hypothetical protein